MIVTWVALHNPSCNSCFMGNIQRKMIWNVTESIKTGQIARILPVPIKVTTQTTAGSKHF